MIPAPDEWLAYLGWRDAFREILDPQFYTIEWLDEQVLSGKAVFICTDDSATVCEFHDYPTGARSIHALLAAGSLYDIKERLIPIAISCGRSNGCSVFDISSREGWAKALKELGFEAYQSSVRREI